MLFFRNGWTGESTQDFHFPRVSSIGSSSKLGTAKITISASGVESDVTGVMDADAKVFVEEARAMLTSQHGAPAAPPASAEPVDLVARAKELGELHAAGLLDDEEFKAAKAKLLA